MSFNKKAFTLIELLIVIGIIAILAAAVIIAINPGQQFAAARDATRENHINSIKNSILSYQIDNTGSVSNLDITTTPQEICQTGASDCTGLADLSGLTDYISQIPVDPQGGEDENGTGYYIFKLNGEVAIQANNAETRTIKTGRWSFTDPRDDQSYKTVLIGDQLWMAENMNYDNGCYTLNNTTWTDGTYSSCRHNETAGTEEESRDTYGLLYQWSAAMNGSATAGAQGICPDGWHLPTDSEWQTMEEELGMADANTTGWRYSGDVGAKLKGRDDLWDTDCQNISNWDSGANPEVCHTSGFIGLPARRVSTDGTSYSVGSNANFWSSTESSTSGAWRRYLYHDYSGVYRGTSDKAYGFSVRCTRD